MHPTAQINGRTNSRLNIIASSAAREDILIEPRRFTIDQALKQFSQMDSVYGGGQYIHLFMLENDHLMGILAQTGSYGAVIAYDSTINRKHSNRDFQFFMEERKSGVPLFGIPDSELHLRLDRADSPHLQLAHGKDFLEGVKFSLLSEPKLQATTKYRRILENVLGYGPLTYPNY